MIWAANGFALLGLRALFVLVEELIKRFRYLDQTVAVVLGRRRREAADPGPLQGAGADRAWRWCSGSSPRGILLSLCAEARERAAQPA